MGKIFKRGFSLKKAVFTSSMISMIIILLVLFLFLAPTSKRILTRSALLHSEEMFRERLESINTYIEQVNDTLHLAEALVSDLLEKNQEWLANIDMIMKSDDNIIRVGYYDMQGAPVYVSKPLKMETEYVSDCDWFRVALARNGTAVYYSVPYVQHYCENRYEYIISVSKMFHYTAKNGDICEGVVVVDIRYKELADLMERTRLEESGYMYVLDEYDQIVWHPNMRQIASGLYHEDVNAVVKQVVGTTTDRVGGRERILTAIPLSYGRWRMIGVSYLDESAKIVTVILRTICIAGIIGLVLALVGAVCISFFIGKPIRTLERNIRHIQLGEFKKIPVQMGIQEIQDTTEAINVLIARICVLMDQIKEDQERRRRLELSALQAQIKPHFLYNTLDSIIWLEERGRSRDAIEMTDALAQLFRVFTSKRDSMVSLQEEMGYTYKYLFIQKKRFADKFDFAIEIQPEYLEVRIPKLVIQPVVENAIIHGIDAYGDSIHIQITAKEEDGTLMIYISDDGIGMSSEKLKSLREFSSSGGGVGLKNVHERIQLTFGTAYGVEVESSESEGTTVIIRIPANTEKNCV